MEAQVQMPKFPNDALISYSRKDKGFAARQEKALRNYKPTKGLEHTHTTRAISSS